MNGAHLHLMVNHVSLFALVIGAIVLAVSMRRKSGDLRAVATALFVLAAVFGWITDLSGEEAEAVLKALGTDAESLIHEHEEAAAWALRSCTLVGVLALALEWAVRKKKNWVRTLHWVLLVFAIHGCTVFAATAFLGGQIRHTEIRSEPVKE